MPAVNDTVATSDTSCCSGSPISRRATGASTNAETGEILIRDCGLMLGETGAVAVGGRAIGEAEGAGLNVGAMTAVGWRVELAARRAESASEADPPISCRRVGQDPE